MKIKINLSDLRAGFRLFLKFNKYIIRYWKLGLVTLILGNFSIVLSLINPYIGKILLDKGILAKNFDIFILYTLFGLGIYVINLALGSIHRYLKNYIIRKVRVDLARDVFKKIRKYSLRLFQARSTGGYIFRISNDIISASNVINDTLPNIITTIFKLVLITTIIIFINPKILILIVFFQLVVLLQINLFIKRIEELIRSELEKSENIFEKLNELFSHIYIVKVFGTIAGEVRRYMKDFIKRIRLEIRQTKLNIVSGILNTASNKLFFGLISFYGSLLVIRGQMSLGSLGAIMIYITQGIDAYSSLLNLGQQIILNRIPLQRITELLGQDIEIKEHDKAKEIEFLKGNIEFKGVCFGYGNDKLILEDMDFTIPAFSHIAIVGRSGCGKTTTLNLILRLYDVKKGQIIIEDCDVRYLKFNALYRQIGIALQEPYLWNTTVRGNITYGKIDASHDEIKKAAKMAEIWDFVEKLPERLDTRIGENACRLSEGQKQRIAIARAVIKRPKILILDEAMSSLDSETEDKIVDNLKNEFKDSTVIIISHRISTVKKMDLIYFLKEPSQIEIGIHQELIEKDIKYKELFASQIE